MYLTYSDTKLTYDIIMIIEFLLFNMHVMLKKLFS